MKEAAIREIVANTFSRWGSYSRPELSEADVGKLLAISLGLGCLFNESIEAERKWMQTPNSVFKTRPLTMVLAGQFDPVLEQVEKERNVL